jgi:hypothetical protein
MAMSPADRQVEAREDVKRIECEFNLAHHRIHDYGPEFEIGPVIQELLHRDVIRVGRRPSGERPMEGQTTIDDEPIYGD